MEDAIIESIDPSQALITDIRIFAIRNLFQHLAETDNPTACKFSNFAVDNLQGDDLFELYTHMETFLKSHGYEQKLSELQERLLKVTAEVVHGLTRTDK